MPYKLPMTGGGGAVICGGAAYVFSSELGFAVLILISILLLLAGVYFFRLRRGERGLRR